MTRTTHRPTTVLPALVVLTALTAGCCGDKCIEVGSRHYKLPAVHEPALEKPVYVQNEADDRLLGELLQRLADGSPIELTDDTLKQLYAQSSFPKKFHSVAVAVYQPGNKRMLIVRRKSGWRGFAAALDRIRQHPRYADFGFADPALTRIQVDFIEQAPVPVDLDDLEQGASGHDRFEPGIDGFRLSDGEQGVYFLPGDAFVRSVLTETQLRRVLSRLVPGVDLDDADAMRFVSESYISFGTSWLRLYRGMPVQGPVDKAQVERSAALGIDYALRHMKEDGRFLYFYDSALDTFIDREHPERDPVKDPYYNILRHSGGGLLLLSDYHLSKNPRVLDATKKVIDYGVAQIRSYQLPDGRPAGYVFYNKKAKLGGSGIALALIAEYQRTTKDDTYQPWAERLKNHLLAEVMESGEFRYYKIYLNQPVALEDNQEHFSFYYPGEAVLGLASYYNDLATPEEKPEIRVKLERALHFLLEVRPIIHRKHYQSLPSDSWLMMGINEMWKAPELRQQSYADFVFEDANKMVELSYKADDALYPDYVGSFYYEYGNYPYPDGARAEGLVAALELAQKMGDLDRARFYGRALRRLVSATERLVNTPEAMYFAKQPALAIGGIRFKDTRQWFRIDTIQHVAGYYLKLLPDWHLTEAR